MKRKVLSTLLVVGMVVSMLVGCGGSNSEEATEETTEETAEEATDEETEEATEEETEEAADDQNGLMDVGLDIESVTVATSPGYEPFEYKDGEELVGYDVDIWNEFEARTGIKVEWEFTDFSGLLGLLDSGKADAVSAQMAENEERAEKYCFSDAVDYYGSCVVVSEDNEEIKSVNDLAGKKVGVGAGNSMQAMVEEIFPNGEVNFEVYQSATLENMMADLMMGRIDAVLAQDIQTYMAMKKSDDLKIKVLDPFAYDPAQIIFHKDNTALRDAVNKVIAAMREDGTLKELSIKYVGEDITVEKGN